MGHTVVVVTCCVVKMILCSSMVGQCLGTMTVASSDEGWL